MKQGAKSGRFSFGGEAYSWLTAIALMTSLLMIAGLLFLIASKGLGFFWPSQVARATLGDGSVLFGQFAGSKQSDSGDLTRFKIGNRDIYGLAFRWVSDDEITAVEYPASVFVIQRWEWGDMIGEVKEIRAGGKTVATGADMETLNRFLTSARDLRDRVSHLAISEVGDIVHETEKIEKRVRKRGETPELMARLDELGGEYDRKEAELETLYARMDENTVVIVTAEGHEKEVSFGGIERMYAPNAMGFFSKAGLYAKKFWVFVSADPREANTEGGIAPAIFGTVIMVILMSVMVMPLGVLAALYLSEYSKKGAFVRIVRICVNNLAGVPSIVFGVFGLGFFVYGIGGLIDSVFFSQALPAPTFGTGGVLWASLTLALLTVPVVIVSTEEGLSQVPRNMREGSLALGATKFETVWKVVLPAALPGVMTGLILAVARAAGEVAPLMLTGVVKLAPDAIIDGRFPFLHAERKFMHLGFHIYDVGFQSPNVEAVKDIVYATAFLLIIIVAFLNLAAIFLRSKIRERRFGSGI
ncbi:phosphate ABC transporter permease PstA [Candidatus Mycalebacterium sp.]